MKSGILRFLTFLKVFTFARNPTNYFSDFSDFRKFLVSPKISKSLSQLFPVLQSFTFLPKFRKDNFKFSSLSKVFENTKNLRNYNSTFSAKWKSFFSPKITNHSFSDYYTFESI